MLLAVSIALPVIVAALALGMLLRYHLLGGWVGPLLVVAGIGVAVAAGLRHWRAVGWSYETYLRHVEKGSGLTRNEVINAQELSRRLPSMDDPLTRGLAAQAVELGESKVSSLPFSALARSRSLKQPLIRTAVASVVATLLLVASPDAFRSSAARLLRPGVRETPPALTFRIEPGNATIDRGQTVRVQAVVPTQLEDATLVYRANGGAWKSLPMGSIAGGVQGESEFRSFTAELDQVVEATEYAVSAGRQRSELYRLDVVDPLRVTGYEKRVAPPAYTQLAPSQALEADGHLDVLAGSQVSLGLQTTRRDAEGRLIFADGRSIPLETKSGERPAASFVARESGEYRVELTGRAGEGGGAATNWTSDPFRLDVSPDRYPTLTQLSPPPKMQLPPEMSVDLRAECLDDFGITRLDLVFQRNDGAPQTRTLARWQREREARVSEPWNLEEVLMTPGDQVRYHLELTDNDGFSGPKTTRGPECEIVFPTLEEMYAAQAEDRDEQVGSVAKMLDEQKKLREELKKSVQEMKADKKMGWEDQERLRELAERQDKVSEQIDKLAESLDQSLSRMDQANMFSPEMAQKVQEIGDLVREIQSPAFKEQMERLRDAMQKLDRRAMEQALEKLQLSQEELEKSLDRTLEMLKQVLAEEKLDALVQQAEQLAQEQKELNEQLGGEPPKSDQPQGGEKSDSEKSDSEKSDSEKSAGEKKDAAEKPLTPEQSKELAEKQAQLAEELRKLQEQLDQLRKENEKQLGQMNQQMEEKKSSEQLQSAQKNMESAQQQMGQCNKPESLKFGRQAEKELQEFAEQMRAAQQQAQQQQQEEITKRLFALSGQLVTMSKSQEALLQEAPSQPTRDLAVEQARLTDSAKRTMDQLAEVARMVRLLSHDASREMANVVRELEAATSSFEGGDRGEAMGQGRSSATSMNKTVLALLETNNKMCQMQSASGSCSNPMQSMRGLSSQQQQLNQEGQDMMSGQGQGQGRLSPSGSQSEQLAQMAARQQMIRQGLQEVEGALGQDSGVLGRLDDMGKEMEEIAAEMKERGLDQRLLERQQKILSRLLTAQRSLRKEDTKEERISRRGENPLDRESPAEAELGPTALDRLRRGILRGSQDPVPAEFKRLVDDYFRSLAEKP